MHGMDIVPLGKKSQKKSGGGRLKMGYFLHRTAMSLPTGNQVTTPSPHPNWPPILLHTWAGDCNVLQRPLAAGKAAIPAQVLHLL